MRDMPPCARATCGHRYENHQHYRHGDECTKCWCPGYKRPRVSLRVWLRRLVGG